ncbi:hypothetical protein V5O48_001002 [Marasmius crinis-equi]|uniref:HTH CENPB-type domain-containing protein n=1 Tax=Marasmius crinis-equi TaxID=585013 RepID=A0ABR3G039_9AGAR
MNRPSKFPEIESAMLEWIQSPATVRKSLSDTRLREKALSLAKSFHITEDKFKASSGWVENFKHRHGIRNGIYEGSGRNASIARALGAGAEGIEDLVDFDKRDILSRDNHGGASVDRSRDVDDDEHAYSPVATTGHNDFQRVLRSHGQQHPASGGLPRQTYRRASWAASDVADDSSQMNEDTDMGAQLSHSTQSSQSSSHARHTHHTSQHGPPYHPDQSSGRHQDQPPTSYHRDSYPFNHQPAPSSSAPSSTSSTSSHHLSYPSQMYSSHDMQPPALPAINTNLPPSQPSSSSSVHPIQQPTPVEGPSMPYEPRHQASSDSNLLPPVSPSGRRMIPQIAMGPMLELPLPRLPDNSPPTLEDAEMALNRVILYVDTFPPGQSILTLEQRQHLDEIKVVLFKAGAGLPLR